MEVFKLFGSILVNSDDADKSISKTDKNAESLGKTLGKGIKTAAKWGAALAVAGAAVVIALGVKGVKAAATFQKGMANVATLLDGDVKPRVAELGEKLKTLAISSGTSTELLTDGLYQVVSAFGDSADSMKILETASKGAVAGNATVTDSVNLLASVTKGYGDTSSESAKKASDLAFLTVKLGQTTFPELAASMGKVIPIAATLGIKQEELFGATATLTGVTGNTSEVMTQLRGTMSGFLKPTKAMEEALTKLGYSNGKVALESEGLEGILGTLKDTVNGDEIAFSSMFKSVEAKTAVLALTGTQAENFTKKTLAMGDAAGATEAAFKTQTATVSSMWDNLGIAADVLFINIGEKLLPVIQKLLDGVIANMPKIEEVMSGAFAGIDRVANLLSDEFNDILLPSIMELWGYIEPNIPKAGNIFENTFGIIQDAVMLGTDTITAFIDVLILLIDTWALVEPVFVGLAATVVSFTALAVAMSAASIATGIWATVTGVATAVGAAFGAVMAVILSPLGLIAIAIGLLVAAGWLLYKNWDTVSAFFAEIWETIKTIVDTHIKVILILFNMLKDAATQVIGAALDFIVDKFNIWKKIISDTVSNTIDFIVTMFNNLKNTGVRIIKATVQLIVDAFLWLYNHNYYFKDLVDYIVNTFKLLKATTIFLWNAIKAFMITAFNFIKTKAISIFTAITKFIGDIFKANKIVIMLVFNTIKNFIVNKWNSIKDFFIGIGSAISNAMSKPVEDGKKAIMGIIDDAAKWGKSFVDGFIDGITGMLGEVADAAGAVASTVSDFLGFHSPTKKGAGSEADKWAPALVEMFADGIKDNIPKVVEAMTKLGDSLIKALRTKLDQEEKLRLDFNQKMIDAEKKHSSEQMKILDSRFAYKQKIFNGRTKMALSAKKAEIKAIEELTKAEDKKSEQEEDQAKIRELAKKTSASDDEKDQAKIRDLARNSNKSKLDSFIAEVEKKKEAQKKALTELNELIASVNRKELIESRKISVEKLRMDMEDIKTQAENKSDSIELELEAAKIEEGDRLKQKETANENINIAMKEHYAILKSEASLSAAASVLIIDDNQKEIKGILEKYTPDWELAGKSFGERFLIGIESKRAQILNVIREISDISGQNKIITGAKKLWNFANKTGDLALKAEAHKMANDARLAGGTIGANASIPGLAKGGNIRSDGSFLVGENGAELLSGMKGAKVTPLNKTGMVININNPVLFNDRDADKLGELLVNHLKIVGAV